MKKLGLIGKNIQHSLSPKIYQNLLTFSFKYELIDIASKDQLPSLNYLKKLYDGINITSPYKKAYLQDVILTNTASKLNSINCLKIQNGKVFGENTDYFAAREILDDLNKKFIFKKYFIIGDGVMSELFQCLLTENKIPYQVFSRKINENFYTINFSELSEPMTLIINTCSREYVFNSPIKDNFIFWNLNYNQIEIESRFINKDYYFDGFHFLELQAKYAVEFWSTNN